MPGPNPTIVGRLKEAATHTVVYGLGSVLQTALGLVLIPLYTRYYTVEMYGVLTLVTLVGTLAGAFFYFGGSSALSRSYYDYDDAADRRVVVSTALCITAIGAVLQVGLGALAARPLSVALFHTPGYAPAIVVALASSACTFINGLFLMVLRFERRSSQVVVLNLASLAATTALILWLLIGLQMGVMAPILGGFVGQAALTGALAWTCRSQLAPKVSRREVDLQLRFGLSAVVVGLAYYVLDSVDRMFIARFGSLGDVGVYSLGYKIGMVIHILFIIPFSQIWAPMRMQYRDDPSAGELFKVVLTYYWIVGLFATVAVSIFAREILTVAAGRAEYIAAYRVVPYVMLAHLFYGVINIVDFGIVLTRKPMYHVYIFAGAIVFNAALNYVFVPRFGYMAAAYSTLASYVAVAAVFYAVANRLHPLPVEGRRIAMVLLSGAVVLFAGSHDTTLTTVQSVAAKCLLIGALAAFWHGFVLTDWERLRLRTTLLPNVH